MKRKVAQNASKQLHDFQKTGSGWSKGAKELLAVQCRAYQASRMFQTKESKHQKKKHVGQLSNIKTRTGSLWSRQLLGECPAKTMPFSCPFLTAFPGYTLLATMMDSFLVPSVLILAEYSFFNCKKRVAH